MAIVDTVSDHIGGPQSFAMAAFPKLWFSQKKSRESKHISKFVLIQGPKTTKYKANYKYFRKYAIK